MTPLLEHKALIVVLAFIAMFALEHIRPAEDAPDHPFKRIAKNLAFWPLNIALSLAIILPVSAWASEHALWARPGWLTGPFALAADLILLDFFIFWWHRATHMVPLLWRFHEVHHLDEHLDTTSAIRFHFGEIFFSVFARAVFIILLAVPFTSVLIFEILVLVFTLFHHSNIKISPAIEGPLSRLIITPSIHWVHHHAIQRDTDSNYGTIFSFWDPLFRTRSAHTREQGMKIGVEGGHDTGFLRLLVKPFALRR